MAWLCMAWHGLALHGLARCQSLFPVFYSWPACCLFVGCFQGSPHCLHVLAYGCMYPVVKVRSSSAAAATGSALSCCRLPSTGRWSTSGVVTTNQVARSHGSAGSFEISDPQVLDDVLVSSPRFAGAMTIRPGGPTGGRRSMEGSVHRGNTSLHRNTSQDSNMAATASTPSWLGMSHDVRAQRAKEVLLQVLMHTRMPWLCTVFLPCLPQTTSNVPRPLTLCNLPYNISGSDDAPTCTSSVVAALMHHAICLYRGMVYSVACLCS